MVNLHFLEKVFTCSQTALSIFTNWKQNPNWQYYYWHQNCLKHRMTWYTALYFEFPNATKRCVQLWHQYKLSFQGEWKNGKSQWIHKFCSRDDVIYKNRHPQTEAETWINSTLHTILNCFALICNCIPLTGRKNNLCSNRHISDLHYLFNSSPVYSME